MRIYKWERIIDGNWIKLSSPKMTWLDKQLANIHWQIANILRLIRVTKSIPKGIKRWWKLRQACKKANKTLLRIAKETEARGMKPPPDPEEVVKFMNWAENNGINFENRVQGVPRTPPNSKEVDISKDY